jgi:hypothetical protein
MTFENWLTAQYTRMAAEYRAALSAKVQQFHAVTSAFPVRQAHIDIGIEALSEVGIPSIEKYPEPTQEDREYFKSALKPNWPGILAEYTSQLRPAVNGVINI